MRRLLLNLRFSTPFENVNYFWAIKKDANYSDQTLGEKGHLGGDIFIHGSNVTIGCIPITDDKIRELYLIALEAWSDGQRQIPVYIFPCKFDWLNTYSEYTRYIWKKRETNKGRLYTQGLFKYSMHINYFGDIVLFAGLALLTLRFSMLFIPLAMALNFVFFIIPRLDKYLATKYGAEFKKYAGSTKKFIPGIY